MTSENLPRTSYTCNVCDNCRTAPCGRGDCGIKPPIDSPTAGGVDTPEFARLLLAWHDARNDKQKAISKSTDVSAESNAITSHITALIEAARQESAVVLGIQVEKLLCEKLGRQWSTAGISIVSLIDELATRTPVQVVGEDALPPRPEPAIEGTVYHELHKICYTAPVHFTAEQMDEYGKECFGAALKAAGGAKQ